MARDCNALLWLDHSVSPNLKQLVNSTFEKDMLPLLAVHGYHSRLSAPSSSANVKPWPATLYAFAPS